jgi:exodeoxyribonuclease VII small subunit
MVNNTKSYQDLSDKLDGVIAMLESPSTTIDEAINLYKEADLLIQKLKNYLDNAKNEIKVLTKRSTDKET